MVQNGAREVPRGDIGGPNWTEDGKEGPGQDGPVILGGILAPLWSHVGVMFGTFSHFILVSVLASILDSCLMVFEAIVGHFLETELVWGSETRFCEKCCFA